MLETTRDRGEVRATAPLRQLVLALPFELRARLAFDGELLGEVCRVLAARG